MNNHPPPISSSRWGARTKRHVVLMCGVVLAVLFINFMSILPLVFSATLLSYLLFPVVDFYEQSLSRFMPMGSRSLSVFLTFATVIAGFTLILYLTIPAFIAQLEKLGRDLPSFVDDVEADVEDWLSQPISLNGEPILIDGEMVIPLERFQEITGQEELSELAQVQNFDVFQMITNVIGSLGDLTGPAFSVLGGFFNTIVNIGFLIVIMFYMMRDGEFFVAQVVNIAPPSYQGDIRRLLYELGKVWHAYLRGQILLGLVVGVMVYIAALILGLSNAPLLGVIAGFLEVIPNFGPFIALIPACISALISGSTTFPFLEGLPLALIVIVVWTLIQNIEAMFIVPRVMGNSLNLHPVVVIIAVIAGASVAGILGIILAAPLTASGRVFGRYFYGKLFDFDPFPNPKPSPELKTPFLLRLLDRLRIRGETAMNNARQRNATPEISN